MTGDRVRDEAERLVSAAMTAVSFAARGMGVTGRGSGFATGSAECCVCPVCRVISAMRDPSAEMADKLASGAGDLATAVASLLRTLSRGGSSDDRSSGTREGDEFWESLRQRATAEATAWRTATASTPDTAGSRHDHFDGDDFDGDDFDGDDFDGDDFDGDDFDEDEDGGDPWHTATTRPTPPMAKKVVKKAVKQAAPPAARRPEPDPRPSTEDPTRVAVPVKKAAKKAAKAAKAPAAKQAAAVKQAPARAAAPAKAPAKKAAAKKAPAKKVAAKKVAAKKAAAKTAVPPPEDFG